MRISEAVRLIFYCLNNLGIAMPKTRDRSTSRAVEILFSRDIIEIASIPTDRFDRRREVVTREDMADGKYRSSLAG